MTKPEKKAYIPFRLREEPGQGQSEGEPTNGLERRGLELLRLVFGKDVEIRCQEQDLPGTPDFYLPALKLCVFVDGLYWHGGGSERMLRVGLSALAAGEAGRAAYWLEKDRTNKKHDRAVNKELRTKGYKVARLKEDKLNRFGALGYVSRALASALAPAVAP